MKNHTNLIIGTHTRWVVRGATRTVTEKTIQNNFFSSLNKPKQIAIGRSKHAGGMHCTRHLLHLNAHAILAIIFRFVLFSCFSYVFCSYYSFHSQHDPYFSCIVTDDVVTVEERDYENRSRRGWRRSKTMEPFSIFNV